MPRQLRVFLCHASQDKPAVWKLHRYLKQHGISPWLDQADLLPGQNWEVEIPKALFNSDVILVCLSKNSVNKEGYFQKEIVFALDKAMEKPQGTVFIIPAKLEECDVPSHLSRYQWVDYYRPDGRRRLLLSLYIRAEGLGEDISPVIQESTRKVKTFPLLVAPEADINTEIAILGEKESKVVDKTERERIESDKLKPESSEWSARQKANLDIFGSEVEEVSKPGDFKPPFFSLFFSSTDMIIWLGMPLIAMFLTRRITAGYNFISTEKIVTQVLIWLVYSFLFAIYIWNSYHSVKENQRLVVFFLDRVVGKRGPGSTLLLPIFFKSNIVDLREKSHEIKMEPCITRDSMLVNAGLHVVWQIKDPILSLTKISKVEESMLQLSAAILRTVIAEYSLQETHDRRQVLNTLVQTRIEHIAKNWGIKVNSIELHELQMANNVMKQIENRFN